MRSGISLFVGKNFHLLIIPKKEDSGSSLGQARGWLSVLRGAAPKIDLESGKDLPLKSFPFLHHNSI